MCPGKRDRQRIVSQQEPFRTNHVSLAAVTPVTVLLTSQKQLPTNEWEAALFCLSRFEVVRLPSLVAAHGCPAPRQVRCPFARCWELFKGGPPCHQGRTRWNCSPSGALSADRARIVQFRTTVRKPEHILNCSVSMRPGNFLCFQSEHSLFRAGRELHSS